MKTVVWALVCPLRNVAFAVLMQGLLVLEL